MDQVKEIRFIDSSYRELFRISDGANIKLRFPPEDYEFGKPDTETRPCKYLDETHVRVGTTDFSMHQFAVFMEENGSYEPEIQIRDASIASLSEDERNYLDLQSDEGKTWVAHLSGNFGYDGKRFGYGSDTNENQADKDTSELQTEVHSAVYALRQSLLKNRASMIAFCRANPNAILREENDFSEYGFKLETEARRYFVLCHFAEYFGDLRTQDTRFDIYAYDRAAPVLEQEQTTKQIHFTDSTGKLYFSIPDGGLIQMTKPEGETTVRPCRYVNDTVVNIGGNDHVIGHFIERMNRNGILFAPLEQPEMIEGYSITDKTVVGGMVFALAHNPTEAHPYTTWAGRTGPKGYYDWKHSFSDRYQANAHYMKRCRDAQYHGKRFDTRVEHSR